MCYNSKGQKAFQKEHKKVTKRQNNTLTYKIKYCSSSSSLIFLLFQTSKPKVRTNNYSSFFFKDQHRKTIHFFFLILAHFCALYRPMCSTIKKPIIFTKIIHFVGLNRMWHVLHVAHT